MADLYDDTGAGVFTVPDLTNYDGGCRIELEFSMNTGVISTGLPTVTYPTEGQTYPLGIPEAS